MAGSSALFGLLLLARGAVALAAFRDDIGQVAQAVERATRLQEHVNAARHAAQNEVRALKDMLIRNHMPDEFDKAKAEFDSARRGLQQQLQQLAAGEQGNGAEALAPALQQQATELHRLYDEVLAENEAGMPKYAVMENAALRGSEQPLLAALTAAARQLGERSTASVSTASALAARRYGEISSGLIAGGVVGVIAALLIATLIGQRILARLGGDLEPVVAATRRVAAGDLSGSLDLGPQRQAGGRFAGRLGRLDAGAAARADRRSPARRRADRRQRQRPEQFGSRRRACQQRTERRRGTDHRRDRGIDRGDCHHGRQRRRRCRRQPRNARAGERKRRRDLSEKSYAP